MGPEDSIMLRLWNCCSLETSTLGPKPLDAKGVGLNLQPGKVYSGKEHDTGNNVQPGCRYAWETKAPLLRSQLGDFTPRNIMTLANASEGPKRPEDCRQDSSHHFKIFQSYKCVLHADSSNMSEMTSAYLSNLKDRPFPQDSQL